MSDQLRIARKNRSLYKRFDSGLGTLDQQPADAAVFLDTIKDQTDGQLLSNNASLTYRTTILHQVPTTEKHLSFLPTLACSSA